MERLQRLLDSGEYQGLGGPVTVGVACCQLRPDLSVHRHVFLGLTPSDLLVASQRPPDARVDWARMVHDTGVDPQLEGLCMTLAVPLTSVTLHVLQRQPATFAVVTLDNHVALFELCSCPSDNQLQWGKLQRYIDRQPQRMSSAKMAQNITDSARFSDSLLSSQTNPETSENAPNLPVANWLPSKDRTPDPPIFEEPLSSHSDASDQDISCVRRIFGRRRKRKKLRQNRNARLLKRRLMSVPMLPLHLKNLGRKGFGVPIRQILPACVPKTRCRSYLDPRTTQSDTMLHNHRLRQPLDNRSRHFTSLSLYMETMDGDLDRALDLVLLSFPDTHAIARRLARYKQVMRHRRGSPQDTDEEEPRDGNELEYKFAVCDVISDPIGRSPRGKNRSSRKRRSEIKSISEDIDFPLPVRYSLINKSSFCYDTIQLYEFPPHQIAQEMTLVNAELFLKLTEEDFNLFLKQRPIRMADSPNFYTLADHGGRIARMITLDIVKTRKEEQRVKMLIFYIQVAHHCYKSRDFQSLCDVLSGLQSPPVYRLSRTWQALGKTSPSMLRRFVRMSELKSPGQGYLHYTEELRQCLGKSGSAYLVWLSHLAWHFIVTTRQGYCSSMNQIGYLARSSSAARSEVGGQGPVEGEEQLVELVGKLSHVSSMEESCRERLLHSPSSSRPLHAHSRRRSRIAITGCQSLPTGSEWHHALYRRVSADSNPRDRKYSQIVALTRNWRRGRNNHSLEDTYQSCSDCEGERLGLPDPNSEWLDPTFCDLEEVDDCQGQGLPVWEEAIPAVSSIDADGDTTWTCDVINLPNELPVNSILATGRYISSCPSNHSLTSSSRHAGRGKRAACTCCMRKVHGRMIGECTHHVISKGTGSDADEVSRGNYTEDEMPPSSRSCFNVISCLQRRMRGGNRTAALRKATEEEPTTKGVVQEYDTHSNANTDVVHSTSANVDAVIEDEIRSQSNTENRDLKRSVRDVGSQTVASFGMLHHCHKASGDLNRNQSGRWSRGWRERLCRMCGGLDCVYGEAGPSARLLELQLAALRFPRFLSVPALQRHLRLFDVPVIHESELLTMSCMVEHE